MGFFDKWFNATDEDNNKNEKTLPWIDLVDMAQLNEIKKASEVKLQVIFKHSTRCGISRSVLRRFVEDFDLTLDSVDLFYLDLLNYRDLSNEVGVQFQVIHQSPQLLIIKDGVSIHHASHYDIDATVIEEMV